MYSAGKRQLRILLLLLLLYNYILLYLVVYYGARRIHILRSSNALLRSYSSRVYQNICRQYILSDAYS